MTVTAQPPKYTPGQQPHRCRRRRERVVSWLVVAIGLTLAGFAAFAATVAPSIDTIVVMLSSSPSLSGAMSKSDSDALAGSLRSQFSIVGHTREGAYVLQLQAPLPLDGARAAVNRVRLIPQVVYANVLNPPTAADPVATKAAAAKHPPVERMIVKYRDQRITTGAIGNAPLAASNLERLGTLAGQPVSAQRAMSGGEYLVRLFQGLPVEQAAALARTIAADPAIEYAVPDLRMQPLLVPNDPLYSSQWHYMSPPAEMGGVNLPPAWDITTGSASIVIAVLDTGSLPNHPDLANRYIGGYDFISNISIANDGGARDANAADPGDWITAQESATGIFSGCPVSNSSFHGTHVAGTIGAASNNGTGVAGINWVSKILPVRVLGKCGGFTSDIADGIRWAVGLPVPGIPLNPNPARVLNMSFGGGACFSNGVCQCDAASQSAIDDAVAAGAVPVVAAGNSNRPAVETSPANCNGVITVAATGRQGQRASYSNYGPLVEIAAPGGSNGMGVLSTLNSGLTAPDPFGYTYLYYQGTSMATPHVAGIVSLMLSVNSGLTPAQVTSKLSTSARAFPAVQTNPCTTALCGAGIVDAGAAVLAARGTVQPASTTTTLASTANPAALGASVTLTASVSGNAAGGSVAFNENGSPIACSPGTLSVGAPSTATCTLSSLVAGTHNIIASYGGDANNLASSSAVLAQVVNPAPPGGSVNVALAANGAVASASSSYSGAYPVSALNNNERAGAGWGNGGGWNDGTGSVYPDTVQITFNGAKTIDRVVVYTLQDNFGNPVEPGDTLAFTSYGVRDFYVEGLAGGSWIALGAPVSGNNLVKRTVSFAATSVSAIRVTITNALASYSRLTEIEAWSAGAAAGPPTLTLQSVASGLVLPVDIANAGDGSGRLFIVEQDGRIRILSGGQLLPTSFLDITPLLRTSGSEQGLLGVAFHPNYSSNGYFFVNYTRQSDAATVIARYTRSATDANVADPASAKVLLTIAQPYSNHNGGGLRFGPDGLLYIGMGDGGSANDPENRAQDLGTLLGKMLRINVDNPSPPYYSIPPGNPFQNEIWAYGLRNPWRFSFDRATGDLFIADVGQGAWEEINFQRAGTGAGANYGWRIMEGAHCSGLGGTCPDASLALPVLEYAHTLGCSVTGGFRYRGSASPALAGYYLYGDYCSGRIWGATSTGAAWQTVELKSAGINISTFGEDQAGELYVASYATGEIFRISAQ